MPGTRSGGTYRGSDNPFYPSYDSLKRAHPRIFSTEASSSYIGEPCLIIFGTWMIAAVVVETSDA